MKHFVLPMTFLALMGLSFSCTNDSEMEREEASEEMGHEMDEMGDKTEEAVEDVTD